MPAIVSLLIVHVGGIALTMTGLSADVASFQALSAFSGAGFTTDEATEVVATPVRRKIVALLIRLGSIGVVTMVSSLILSLRYLREGPCEEDFWNAIKYISLGKEAYLTLGGQLRFAPEYYRYYNWGSYPKVNDLYYRHRAYLLGDLHATPNFRLFVQLTHSWEIGRAAGPRPVDQDLLYVNQLFVDIGFSGAETPAWLLRAGRFQLAYGNRRIVTFREGANVQFSHDGLMVRYEPSSKLQVEALVVNPVDINSGVLDNPVLGQNRNSFWGIYAERRSFWSSLLNIDFYIYMGVDRTLGIYDAGQAKETRHASGVCLWKEEGRLRYDLEAVYQVGVWGTQKVRAWAGYASLHYRLPSAASNVRKNIVLNGSYLSGDQDQDDNEMNTFFPYFQSPVTFDITSAFSSTNIIHLYPGFKVTFSRVHIQVGFPAFWRASVADGLYSIPTLLLVQATDASHRRVGYMPEMSLTWNINRHIYLQWGNAYFIRGDFLKQTRSHNMTYSVLYAQYTF